MKMVVERKMVLCLFFLAVAAGSSVDGYAMSSPILDVSSLNRSSFPSGFLFGTASASYQVTGLIINILCSHLYMYIYSLLYWPMHGLWIAGSLSLTESYA